MLNAYKARVEGISPHCETEQIHEGHTWTQSGQFLLGERFIPPTIIIIIIIIMSTSAS